MCSWYTIKRPQHARQHVLSWPMQLAGFKGCKYRDSLTYQHVSTNTNAAYPATPRCLQVGKRKRSTKWYDMERQRRRDEAMASGEYYMVPPERALVPVSLVAEPRE